MKIIKIILALIVLGAFFLLPAIIGAGLYITGMGGSTAAACTPNVSFLITCISGTYVLISTVTGGIMWAGAFVVGVIGFIKKQL